jgi:TadE-like protein
MNSNRIESRRSQRSHQGEAGTSAVELVIGVPAILLVFMLLHLGWAVTQSRADVDFAARSAARAASFAQTREGAEAAALSAAASVVEARKIPCRRPPVVTVQADTDMVPGGLVRVRVSCEVDLSRVTIPRIPASTTYVHEAVAVIDRLRGG